MRGITTSGTRGRLLRAHEPQSVRGGRGAGEQVPLPEVAAEAAQDPELLVGLDALGDRGQVEGVGERDDRGCDRRVLRLVAEPGDKRSVDLERVDGEAAQVRERGEAGAEVV